MESNLEELEARLRDAKFVLSREPAAPEILRILADRIDADGITVYQFYAFLEFAGGAWTLTQPNSFWIRLLDLEDVFDLVAHLHASTPFMSERQLDVSPLPRESAIGSSTRQRPVNSVVKSPRPKQARVCLTSPVASAAQHAVAAVGRPSS